MQTSSQDFSPCIDPALSITIAITMADQIEPSTAQTDCLYQLRAHQRIPNAPQPSTFASCYNMTQEPLNMKLDNELYK